MDNVILYAITMIVVWVMGILAKRNEWISTNLIPIQNILIGVIVMGVEWIVTKDANVALATSGLTAGGAYDIVHNFNKLMDSKGRKLFAINQMGGSGEEEVTHEKEEA